MIIYEKLCQNKKILTSVWDILPMNFCFVLPCCFFSIYQHCPKVMFFLLIMALKRAVILDWEEQLDEVK